MRIKKSPNNPAECGVDLTCFSSARLAWQQVLRETSAQLGRQIRVLLPSYIGENDKEGSGVFDPVRSENVEFEFYALDRALCPSLTDLKVTLANGNYDLVLVVHYFGLKRIPMPQVAQICKENDVVLVEDCAHCIFDHAMDEGTFGQYAFYSLHKIFPVSEGGLLRRNTTRSDEIIEPTAENGKHESLLRTVLSSDVPTIKKIRRRNYRFLVRHFSSCDQAEVLIHLDENSVPQSFPLFIKNGLREKLYFHLLDHGFPTIALYYRLISEIEPAKFPISYEVSQSILNLPVHQETSEEQLAALVNEIGVFFNGD